MKLSEAGLLGSLEVETAKGALFNHGKSCYLGGALLAVGFIPWSKDKLNKAQERRGYEILSVEFPILNKIVIHPINKYEKRLEWVITELNDEYDWTRPAISKWLETIEAQYYIKPIQEPIEQSLLESLPAPTSCR